LIKATAVAHAIQGLVKYHGLKDPKRRIPFHDSISVCVEQLTTTATIEFDRAYAQDAITINGAVASQNETERILSVLSPLMGKAKVKSHFRLATANNVPQGKGLGFSASAFASISLAASTALGLRLSLERLSEFARLGAGSATRSAVGGFSIWYAMREGRSFARQLAAPEDLALSMIVVPIASPVKTDMAHVDSVTSPFFKARISEVKKTLRDMLHAIKKHDIGWIGRLAERESLSLHAITMTGKNGLFLMEPDTVRIIQHVKSMREEQNIPVWFSLDTGPSVYINTRPEFRDTVAAELQKLGDFKVIQSHVGGPAHTVDHHLF